LNESHFSGVVYPKNEIVHNALYDNYVDSTSQVNGGPELTNPAVNCPEVQQLWKKLSFTKIC
jgi:hypothetical protein